MLRSVPLTDPRNGAGGTVAGGLTSPAYDPALDAKEPEQNGQDKHHDDGTGDQPPFDGAQCPAEYLPVLHLTPPHAEHC